MTTMSQRQIELENMTWEHQLTELILSHAQIVYAEKIHELRNPTLHVISSKETHADGRIAFRTHIFAYVPAHSKKRVLLISTRRRSSISEGLNTLLIMLREKLNECVTSCELMGTADVEDYDGEADPFK